MITSGLSRMVAHHPWWLVAALAVPAVTAAWAAIAPHLLESRHQQHMFGSTGDG